METLRFDLTKKAGKFKLLNCTNGGPWHKRGKQLEDRGSNMANYIKARIPYSRNHDSGACGVYGGPYSHDVCKIFPRFEADPYDPVSYDFACTDEDILICLEAGTKTYFRLGETIEHQVKKHATLPPADFHKWAVICEHIIRHYTEGWAGGFTHDMPYWEIWNEADMHDDDAPNKTCWGGTKAQFFNFYEIVAKHLKTCFPHLKIGGPALGYREDWADDFLREMKARNVPIDFFSWHNYRNDPMQIMAKAERLQKIMENNGYEDAENHLTEWNYIINWTDKVVDSFKDIHGIRGAAFTLSTICAAQNSPIDMLMYYDTRPSRFNGIFDFYSYLPLKGYYALSWYGKLYDMEAEIKAQNSIEHIYSLCGVDKNGKATTILTYYPIDDSLGNKAVKVDLGRQGRYEVFLLDENHTNESMGVTEDLTFDLAPNTCVLIQEV